MDFKHQDIISGSNKESLPSESAFADPLLLHWLWLMIVPVVIIVTMIYYRHSLKKLAIRLSDKLSNVTKPFQVSDSDNGSRWRTTYFILPSETSPPVTSVSGEVEGDQRCLNFELEKDIEDDRDGEHCILLYDKSWPYPYNATAV